MHSILIYFKLTSDSQKYSTASIFLFQAFFNKVYCYIYRQFISSAYTRLKLF